MAQKIQIKCFFRFFFIILFFQNICWPISAQIADSILIQQLIQIFPEINNGYIDLNNNGQMDETVDLDEKIPESKLRDNQLQGKEVLDFIISNYMFLPTEKVMKVKEIIDSPQGTISEIVALRYKLKIYEIEKKREQMKGTQKVMTESDMQKAKKEMENQISTMVTSYEIEGKAEEEKLVTARKEFLDYVKQGYEIPINIDEEQKDILSSILINSVIKEKDKDPETVKSAITVIGHLKNSSAVEYLLDIIKQPDYRLEGIRALGKIADKSSLNRLLADLDSEKEPEIKKEIVKALGNIGSPEVIRALDDLINKSANNQFADKEVRKEAVLALASIAEGTNDKSLIDIFLNFLISPDPFFRMVAVRGLANMKATLSGKKLNDMLETEPVIEVQAEIIIALNKMKYTNALNTFLVLLRKKDLDIRLRETLIASLGDNPLAKNAIPNIVIDLGHENEKVQQAAIGALINQYKHNPKMVVSTTSGYVIRAKDKPTLVNGTRVLSLLRDPDSMNYIISLINNDYKEVKQNVTWALYRIGETNNAKVVNELKKVAESGAESISVRVNAIRAIGAIGYSSFQVDTVSTMLNILKNPNESYIKLRKYAILALGELGNKNEKIEKALIRSLEKESDIIIKRSTLRTVAKLGIDSEEMKNTIRIMFRKPANKDLKLDIITCLGDLKDDAVVSFADDLLNEEGTAYFTKKEIVYVLSLIETKYAIESIISVLKDREMREYIVSVLIEYPVELITPIVKNRIKAESNKNTLEALDEIMTKLDINF